MTAGLHLVDHVEIEGAVNEVVIKDDSRKYNRNDETNISQNCTGFVIFYGNFAVITGKTTQHVIIFAHKQNSNCAKYKANERRKNYGQNAKNHFGIAEW